MPSSLTAVARLIFGGVSKWVLRQEYPFLLNSSESSTEVVPHIFGYRREIYNIVR